MKIFKLEPLKNIGHFFVSLIIVNILVIVLSISFSYLKPVLLSISLSDETQICLEECMEENGDMLYGAGQNLCNSRCESGLSYLDSPFLLFASINIAIMLNFVLISLYGAFIYYRYNNKKGIALVIIGLVLFWLFHRASSII